jgi:hypothetical protein
MEKRNYSQEKHEKPKKPSKKKKKLVDPCLVCDGELFLDGDFTQRIGLIDDFDEVYGWLCPHCKSEFDLDGKITSLNGQGNVSGEA